MEYISTDLLEEDLIVAKDVHSQSKMLLIPAGTKLTSNKIQMLKTWGVHRIFIEANEDLSATQNVINQKAIEKMVDSYFIHNPPNKFINSLKMASSRYLRRKMSEEL
jgi:hypothetical protein